MGFCMAYCFATFMMILMIHVIICPVNGQGCDNKGQLLSIVDAIQQLRDELLHRLDKQDQSISKAADRCPLERDICREQLRSVFSESFLELKNQHGAIVTSLQAVDGRLEKHDISIRNQIQKWQTFANGDRMDNFVVGLSNSSANPVRGYYALCGQYPGPAAEGANLSLQCNPGTPSGRYVIVQQARNGNGGLTICEIDIYTEQVREYNCDPVSDVCDCSDIKAYGQNQSGVYEVCVGHQLNRTCTSAFCDMETANVTSLVFQRRQDGSVDFNRTWDEFSSGFGNPEGEFWLGNEMLYLLTSKRNYKLRVDLEDWEGAKRYAEFATFSINSSDDNYRLTVSGYSGTAGDSMSYYNGKQFTTIDVDNDEDDGRNCALVYGGAWWHRNCGHSALNGKYYQRYDTVIASSGIHWYFFKSPYRFTYSLKATEMKLVPVA